MERVSPSHLQRVLRLKNSSTIGAEGFFSTRSDLLSRNGVKNSRWTRDGPRTLQDHWICKGTAGYHPRILRTTWAALNEAKEASDWGRIGRTDFDAFGSGVVEE